MLMKPFCPSLKCSIDSKNSLQIQTFHPSLVDFLNVNVMPKCKRFVHQEEAVIT